jgi:hypothetical protein
MALDTDILADNGGSAHLRLGLAGVAKLLPGRHDGRYDSRVTRAATDVAAELASHGLSIRLGYPQQNVAGHHQHARGTESALQGMALVEMAPQYFHRGIVLEAFESLHCVTIAHDRKSQTRAGGLSIHSDRAGATSSVFTTKVGGR